MYFVSDEHEEFYNQHSDIVSRGNDYEALIYTLGISSSCREHFSGLYNVKERCIIPEGLFQGWQTGGSKRITRLAFNLFTHNTVVGDDPESYAPKELFSGLDEDSKTGAVYAILYYA